MTSSVVQKYFRGYFQKTHILQRTKLALSTKQINNTRQQRTYPGMSVTLGTTTMV